MVEGLNLLMKTSDKTLQYVGWYHTHIKRLNYFIGWLLPFLIVAPAVLAGFLSDSYMENYSLNRTVFPLSNYEVCWLNSKSLIRVYAVIIPIGVMMLVNAIFVVRTVFFVAQMKKKERSQQPIEEHQETCIYYNQVLNGLKVVLLLSPVTGLPWMLLLNASKQI